MHKIKLYILLLGLGAVGFTGFLITIIKNQNPESFGSIILFYSILFAASFCIFTLLGFYARRLMGQRELVQRYLDLSARQAVWLSLIVLISLFLLSQNWFNWLNAGLLVLTLISLEAYLIVKRNDQ